MTHWKTTFDFPDGDPSGEPCDCGIGEDHDDTGNIMTPLFPLDTEETSE